ncbi:MAG: hypothetical protein AAFX09_01110 [Pseudomonadota bacterium]
MTKRTKGVHPPRVGKSFFIGYAPLPSVDRRSLVFGSAAVIAGAGGLAWAMGSKQAGAGFGAWDMGTQVALTGYVQVEPYAAIRVVEEGAVRTVLLGCETKCGARARLEEIGFNNGAATVRGTLMQRGRYRMLATGTGSDWITSAEISPAPAPVAERLGAATLRGEILDSKCWFGAMRPNEGLSHKACATLCIANGVPPYFGVRDASGNEQALMLTDLEGRSVIAHILPYVAEPVELVGELVRFDDLVQFRIDPAQINRLS